MLNRFPRLGFFEKTLKRLCDREILWFARFSTKSSPKKEVRNVGIMAHIDAGKTTTTERLLYYSGATKRLGTVDDGNTVTDYMKLERERGITIGSACVTYEWRGCHVNLIDTPVKDSQKIKKRRQIFPGSLMKGGIPRKSHDHWRRRRRRKLFYPHTKLSLGHVDFTIEVERSLRVLDGVVAVFDASVGVQAQSMSVWKQARRYEIPVIAFINKMDKQNANFSLAVDSLAKKLNIVPLVMQLSVVKDRSFKGVMDLVSEELYIWSGEERDGREFLCLKSGSIPNGLLDRVAFVNYRRKLVEQVASVSEELVKYVVENDIEDLATVPAIVLMKAIRECTLERTAVPVFCGSALRNIGIQPLMNAINIYLPAPHERRFNSVPDFAKDLLAFAFKVIHDPQRGLLVFLRVYAGRLKPQSTLYNATRGCHERINRLFVVFGEQLKEVNSMGEGDVVAAIGLKNTFTGDVLVLSSKIGAEIQKISIQPESVATGGGLAVTRGLTVPEPVFFCTIEPSSAYQQKELDRALQCISKEDPSLRVSTDSETGQTILSGMGELHLEVVMERIKSDYKVDAVLGKLHVAYREAPSMEGSASYSIEKVIGSKREEVTCAVTVKPTIGLHHKSCDIVIGEGVGLTPPSKEVMQSLVLGINSALSKGPCMAYPLTNVQVTVDDVALSDSAILPLLSGCVSECTSRALLRSECELYEPLMNIEILLPEEYLGTTLNDLTSKRRAQIIEISTQDQDHVISAYIPLSSVIGYSTTLRSITSGMCTISMEFSHYTKLSRALQENVIADIRGY